MGVTTVEGTLKRALSGAHAGEAWHRANFTKLCKIQPPVGRNACGLTFYPTGTLVTLEERENMKFRFGEGEAICKKSTMEGLTIAPRP